jgi:hypothetical protein
VRARVLSADPDFQPNRDFRRDAFNVAVGVVAQTCLVAAPIFLVVRESASLAATLAVFLVSATILKKTWYDKLERTVPDAAS